jgi:GxxExxY protein
MNTDKDIELNALTEKIIGCSYHVSNSLGCGMYEAVYENSMVVALKKIGLHVEQQVRFKVYYEQVEVGEYIADLVVEGMVLVELKAVSDLTSAHSAQCINILAITGLPVCLLINFGKPKVEIERFKGRRR